VLGHTLQMLALYEPEEARYEVVAMLTHHRSAVGSRIAVQEKTTAFETCSGRLLPSRARGVTL